MAPGETLTYLPPPWSERAVLGSPGKAITGSTLDHTLMKVIILRRREGNLPAESRVGLELIEI